MCTTTYNSTIFVLINSAAQLPAGERMETCHLKHTARIKTEAQKICLYISR